VEVKKLAAGRTQATLTFNEAEVTQAEEISLKRKASGVSVPGFRPGKAPLDMVRNKANPEDVLDDVVRSLVSPFLRTLVEEHKIKPIIPPSIKVETLKPLKVTLTFVEKPAVKVKGADKIRISKTEPKADAKDVERMVQYLLEQERTYTEVDRAAKEGDQVTMDFHATDKEGVDVPGTRATGYANIIGSKSLLPGFEEALHGLKKDEQKSFPLTFPAQYHAEHLRGKPVTFHVGVTKVEETRTPELTEEFVKKHDLGKTPEDLKKRIADSLRAQEEETDRQRRERELYDAVVKATQADLAPELLEQVERSILEEMEHELGKQNMTLQDWMEKTKKAPEAMRKDLQEQAKRRLLLRFGIEELMEERKIAVTEEEMGAVVSGILGSVPPEQREQAVGRLAKGSEEYEQLKWRRMVEKLVEEMLR
jgi:trigger factor